MTGEDSAGGLNSDFADLLQELEQAGVEYVIVGAHAMAVHGVPRATGDLDVLIRPTQDNAARVVQALQAFGAPIDAHGVTADDLSTPGTVYQIGLPPRRIDILSEITGVDFDEAWSSRETHEVAGLRLPFLGREALIRNKRATGRDKDRTDLGLLAGDED
jgi:hypothetical protein